MFDEDDLAGSEGPGPWPAFADLLSATTLLFLILFAAIAVPAIARALETQEQLSDARERESTLAQIHNLIQEQSGQVDVRRVGDYLLVTINGDATFPANRYELGHLRQEGRQILRSFGHSIQGRPELLDAIDQIQVVGHTSREGGDELNWRLSASRATTVALFLIDSIGISPCKVTALGRGRHYPLDPAEARAGAVNERNRRIELEIRPIIPGDSEQEQRRQGCVDYREVP